MSKKDRLLFNPSGEEGSSLESLQATTVYWMNVGDGRVDRMVSKSHTEMFYCLANTFLGDIFHNFESFLLGVNGLQTWEFDVIRELAYQKLSVWGVYTVPAFARALASVFIERYSAEKLAKIIYQLEIQYRSYQIEVYGHVRSGNPAIINTSHLHVLMEGILNTYE